MASRGKVTGEQQKREEIERPARLRHYHYLFLIVCEDGLTEPYYFEQFEPAFPPETVYFRRVGAGLDPQGVVERAVSERAALAAAFNRTVDFTWVVFDKDDADLVPAKVTRFNYALQLAAKNEFRLAFSNEVFELWLLLHLTDVDPAVPIPRADIYTQLEVELRKYPALAAFRYVHGQTDVVDAIRQVGDEPAAIARAEALAVAHAGRPLLQTNPSTRVYELVQELQKWIAYFGFKPEKRSRSNKAV